MMSLRIKQAVAEFEGQEPSTMKEKTAKEKFPKEFHYDVGFEGNFGRNHVTPRGLNAYNVGKLVLVQGIVTKLSLVKVRASLCAFIKS